MGAWCDPFHVWDLLGAGWDTFPVWNLLGAWFYLFHVWDLLSARCYQFQVWDLLGAWFYPNYVWDLLSAWCYQFHVWDLLVHGATRAKSRIYWVHGATRPSIKPSPNIRSLPLPGLRCSRTILLIMSLHTTVSQHQFSPSTLVSCTAGHANHHRVFSIASLLVVGFFPS